MTVTDSRSEIIKSLKIQFKKYSKTIKFNTDVFPERIIPTSNLRGAFLVMTHSHANDFNIIEELLRCRSKNYIGMIGSKTKKLASNFPNEEKDVILSTGEQISCALISGKLNALGYKSRSWLGWQIPILTRGNYSSSRIIKIQKQMFLKEREINIEYQPI